MKRTAFTMIELIFVIVVLGILASIALPKMGGVMTSSYAAAAQGDVSAIRAAIAAAKQSQLVKGKNEYPVRLTNVDGTNKGDALFDGDGKLHVLTYPIYAKETGGWIKTGAFKYKFSNGTDETTFTYDKDTGIFDCNHNDDLCKKIVE